MRIICVMIALVLMFYCPSWSKVELLFPLRKVITSRSELHLILASDCPVRVVPKRGSVKLIFRIRDGNMGKIYYHYTAILSNGRNEFFVDPGGIKIVVVRRSGRFRVKFHRKDQEKKCAGCHKDISTGSPTCFKCHRFKKGRRVYMHGPFARGECFSCHRPSYSDGVRFGPMGNNDYDLCSKCHYAPKVWQDMAYQHGPFGARSCTSCHDPHQGDYKFLLRKEPKVRVCTVCHRDKAKEFSNPDYSFHPILTAKGCTVCHDPHASDYPKQLFSTPFKVCVSCHPKCGKMKRGHPIVAHPVVGPVIPGTNRKLTCSGCHDPHGSIYENLLYAPRAGNKICLRCHKY